MAGSVQFPLATLLQALARKHKNKHRSVPKLKHFGTSRREPKRRFILYCEGENTERTYFEAIKRLCTNSLIEVEIVARGDVPYTLAKKLSSAPKMKGLRRTAVVGRIHLKKTTRFGQYSTATIILVSRKLSRFADKAASKLAAPIHVLKFG